MLMNNWGGRWRHVALVLAACVACNALLLANPYGLYFEDWKLYGKTDGEIAQIFSGAPVFYLQWLMVELHRLLPLEYWRALEWLLHTCSAVLFYLTVRQTRRFPPLDCLLVALVFVAAPLYMARISVLLVMRAILFLLLMSGLHLALITMKSRRRALRLASLALLFLALEFSGFVPLYLLTLLALLFVSAPGSDGLSLRLFLMRVLRHADYIALPFLSFFLRLTVTIPTGVYEKTYQTSPLEMSYAMLKTVDVVLHNIVGLIDSQFLTDSIYPLAMVFCLLLYMLSKRGNYYTSGEDPTVSTKGILLFSLAAMYAAIFPYLVTGKFVLYTDWESRNQFLLPIGMSFFVVYTAKHVLPRRFFVPVILSLLLVFACVDNLVWASFYRDWVKQQAFAELAAGNAVVQAKRDFAVYDRCTHVNALRRIINPQEYYSALRYRISDGEERVFYAWGIQHRQNLHGPWLFYPQDRPVGEVYICELRDRRPISLTNGSLFSLLSHELRDPQGFGRHAAEYFTLEVYDPRELFADR